MYAFIADASSVVRSAYNANGLVVAVTIDNSTAATEKIAVYGRSEGNYAWTARSFPDLSTRCVFTHQADGNRIAVGFGNSGLAVYNAVEHEYTEVFFNTVNHFTCCCAQR